MLLFQLEVISMNRPIIAILYDFDKTLSTTDMQNYSFIPNLGMTPEEFWNETVIFSDKYQVDKILAYMYCMVKFSKEKGIKLTKKYLRECGKKIKFFPGVSTWFKRINDFAMEKGVVVEHYLVSSGTKEIVEGCSIYDEFKQVYGCEYLYDENGEACWPKMAINFTQKTQFFFRVAKGAIIATDDVGVNVKTFGLRVPYRNIIYVGDGMTDIPSMTLVKKNGGHSIAVHPKDDKNIVKQIYQDDRCDFLVEADYTANSEMDKVVKMLIELISLTEKLERKEKVLANK